MTGFDRANRLQCSKTFDSDFSLLGSFHHGIAHDIDFMTTYR